jgi:hypothetical protein
MLSGVTAGKQIRNGPHGTDGYACGYGEKTGQISIGAISSEKLPKLTDYNKLKCG